MLGDVAVPDEVLTLTSRLCAELDAEGLRADLVLARGVAALAALDGRKEATAEDVVRLAPLALAHRRRRARSTPPACPRRARSRSRTGRSPEPVASDPVGQPPGADTTQSAPDDSEPPSDAGVGTGPASAAAPASGCSWP